MKRRLFTICSAALRIVRTLCAPRVDALMCLSRSEQRILLRDCYRRSFRWWQWWAIGLAGASLPAIGIVIQHATIWVGGWVGFAMLVGFYGVVVNRRLNVVMADVLIARGLCPTCGYDLRATPSRCPECGAERVMQNRE